jgi:F-type H+-transporting ATPase subunit b
MGTLASYLNAVPLQAESDSSDNPLLSISPGLMIWTLVMFGITLFIMKRYVFGPVGEMIEKRRRNIAESIEEAERSRDEATALLEEYKAQLVEARTEADTLRERVLTDAESQISAQARAAASGLRDDVVDLALLAAEKVSRSSLSEADHRRLIEEAIAEIDLGEAVGSSNGGSATS